MGSLRSGEDEQKPKTAEEQEADEKIIAGRQTSAAMRARAHARTLLELKADRVGVRYGIGSSGSTKSILFIVGVILLKQFVVMLCISVCHCV